MLEKQDGWNEVRGFVGGGRSTTLLWDVILRERKWKAANATEIIVFGRFLLDCVPIQLNEFNGIGWKMSRCWRGERDIDGRAERKRAKETVALQGSITSNCELWYLLHQVPCGFIALGQCLEEEGDY